MLEEEGEDEKFDKNDRGKNNGGVDSKVLRTNECTGVKQSRTLGNSDDNGHGNMTGSSEAGGCGGAVLAKTVQRRAQNEAR